MPKTEEIAVTNLLLDVSNPRLPNGVTSQTGAHEELWTLFTPKMFTLATDIAEHGLNAADLVMVTREAPGSRRFVVLEGNRRISAIRALREPEGLTGILKPTQVRRLIKLASAFSELELTRVNCVIYPDRAEADRWIDLRHSSDQGGKGIVPWQALEKLRRAERQGKTIAKELAVLNTVLSDSTLTDAERQKIERLDISNVQRMIEDGTVLDRLGVSFGPGNLLQATHSDKAAKAALTKLLRVIAHLDNPLPHRFSVKDIYTADDRKALLNLLAINVRLGKRALPTPVSIAAAGQPSTATTAPAARAARARREPERVAIVPPGYKLHITDAKAAAVFDELQSLPLIRYPSSIGVMLRVLLELSVASYLNTKGDDEKERRYRPLSKSITLATTHLVEDGRLRDSELKSVRRAVTSSPIVIGDISALNMYAHSLSLHAAPLDLTTLWSNLEPLLQAIWPQP